jgi:hypothetical protein
MIRNLHTYFFIARILPPPAVTYRQRGSGEVAEKVTCGKWTIRNRFYTTRDINRWGMIYFGPKCNAEIAEILNNFKSSLPKVNPFSIHRLFFLV